MDRKARPRRDNFEEEDPFAVGFADIEGVDDGHFKTSIFLLSTEIRNSWWMGGTFVPELLGLCNHGRSSHELGLPLDFASFCLIDGCE